MVSGRVTREQLRANNRHQKSVLVLLVQRLSWGAVSVRNASRKDKAAGVGSSVSEDLTGSLLHNRHPVTFSSTATLDIEAKNKPLSALFFESMQSLGGGLSLARINFSKRFLVLQQLLPLSWLNRLMDHGWASPAKTGGKADFVWMQVHGTAKFYTTE